MRIAVYLTVIVLLVLSQLGGRYSYLDMINHFLLFVLVSGFLVVVVEIRLWYYDTRSFFPPVLLLSLIFLIFFERVLPELLPDESPALEDRNKVKIISFNMHKNNDDYASIVKWLNSEGADIVILLEGDQTAIEALAPTYPFATDCLKGRTLCSTIILSKVQPLFVETHAMGDPENRGALSALSTVFCFGGAPVSVMGVHLSRPGSGDIFQRDMAQLLTAVHGRSTESVILAGDFNLTPWSFEMRKLVQSIGLTRAKYAGATWPSNYPGPALLAIDHIFSSADLSLASINLGPPLGSDHKPLVATYYLPAVTATKALCRR